MAPQLRRAQKCRYCDRDFSRSDSLRRHYRTHDPRRPTTTRRKSCRNCVRSKVRCSGDLPSCAVCQRRSLYCSYHISTTPTAEPAPEDVPRLCVAGAEVESTRLSAESPKDSFAATSGGQGLTMQTWSPLPLNQVANLWDFPDASLLSNSGYLDPEWLFSPSVFNHTEFFMDFTPNPLDFMPSPEGNSNDRLNLVMNAHTSTAQEALPVPSPKDNAEPDNPWPMEWQANLDQPISLPNLGNFAECTATRRFATEIMTTATCDKIVNTLKLPLERGPWKPFVSPHSLTSVPWDLLIDLYFARFNLLIPIVHRPTFSPNSVASVVIIAMAVIGACYSEFESRHQFAAALWELNRRLLWFMSESDPRHIRTDYYMTAQLLQSIFAKSSGEKRLFELSESSRSQLINNAASMGLFQDCAVRHDEADTERCWRSWINEESLCRLGWGIYVYDSTVSFQLNKRPCASLAMIQLSLPSADEYWNAETAQMWNALHPSERWAPERIPFRPIITAFLSDEATPIQDANHREIVTSTLARMIWTQGDMAASFRAYFSRAARAGRDRAKTDVLRVFNFVNPTSPASPLGGCTARHLQIQHMARLYAADELMGWLFLRLRGGKDSGKAEVEMRRWAEASPTRVCWAAFHGAQILALIRHFPEHHPREPFNAFYAGVVIWHMACWLRSRRTRRPETSTHFQLDALDIVYGAGSRSKAHESLYDWVHAEAPHEIVVGLHGIADIAAGTGPAQIREYTLQILKSMPVWNIAQAFYNVFVRLVEPF